MPHYHFPSRVIEAEAEHLARQEYEDTAGSVDYTTISADLAETILQTEAAAHDLLKSAKLVLARWSKGDLAEAVRQLSDAVDAAEAQPGERPEARAEIDALIEKAEDAFWRVVADHFPAVTTGDLSPSTTAVFSSAAEAAVTEWIELNAVA
jgi:hypothetical protein